MATRQMSPMKGMVRHLRRAVLLKDRHTLSDGRLVDAFLSGRDEAAFEILVKRHGPTVLNVCRRVLGNVHDAEDAFQAAFLVLARKAGSIVPREHVANWLYGVAYRTALQARAKLGRRRAHEKQVNDMPHPTVPPELDLRELCQALDLELSKLPDKYRLPIVLCDLEARSRKEVAAHLRIAEGTLSSRLAVGRQKLARRLERHGLCLAGGALATTLSQQAAFAGVPTTLVATTVKVAGLVAAGQSAAGLISSQVLALSQGVLKTMLLQKLKLMFLVAFGVLLGGMGVGVIGLPAGTGDQAIQAAQTPPPAAPQRVAADEPEPLDGGLLLDPKIQEELRLSKNQVKKLQDASQDADVKNDGKKKQIKEIQKKIAELQKQIAAIQKSIDAENVQASKIHQTIAVDRMQAVSQAAPKILSARAAQRTREIQRQKRGIRQLLQDPKVQRMLKLDDEQMMKIEEILKKEPKAQNYYTTGIADFWTVREGVGTILHNNCFRDAALLYQPLHLNLSHDVHRTLIGVSGMPKHTCTSCHQQPHRLVTNNITYLARFDVLSADPKTHGLLMNVLSQTQRKKLLDWVGPPYQSPSWQELWDKHGIR